MILVYSLFLLLTSVSAGTIYSNIPTIVSPTKNYTTAAPTWLTSPYFRAGYEKVIQTLTGNDKTPTYTFTFSSALPGLPILAYGIKNYRGNDYFWQEFYEIKKIGLTSGTFTVSIQIYGATNIWLLSVAYLAVDPTFPHHLNSFDNVPINQTAGALVNITTMKDTLSYYTNYINYTAQAAGLTHNQFTLPYSSNKIVLFMTSFWVRGTLSVKFHIYTGIVNQSHYFWNATLETMVLVTNVHFSQIIFNSDDVQSSKQYFIIYSLWYNDMYGGFLQIPQEFVNNFIMGITSFETVAASCGFEYQWQFTNQTVNGSKVFGVELLLSWTLTNTCGFAWSESSIFYMQTWKCDPPFYYFNLTSGQCQTLCGGYTYENPLNFTCQPCVNTLCYQCSDPKTNLCTECSTSKYFELVNGTCACTSGYFHSNSVCTPISNVDSACLTCSYNDGSNGTLPYNSSLFACTLCKSGFLLINGKCYSCASSDPYCTVCSYGENISLPFTPINFTCLACNTSAAYFINPVNKCIPCSLSNCNTCSTYSTCSICDVGFDLTTQQLCIICSLNACQTCFNASICAACSPGYSLIDGLCYLCPSSCTCGGYSLPKLSNGDCSTICGDGYPIFPYEDCDDGNMNDGDGCSSTCQVQPFSTCLGQPSACYLTSPIIANLMRIDASSSPCNVITFTFQLVPYLILEDNPTINWFAVISTLNASILYSELSSRYYNGTVSLTYAFNSNIQSLTLMFSFDPQYLLSPNYLRYQLSSSIEVVVFPDNNIPAVYIGQKTCSNVVALQQFLYAQAGIGYLGLLLSLFSCKIIGLEMFGVLQLSYFSLSNYDYVPPALMGVLQRKEVNGLNIQTSSASDNNIPSRVSSNGYIASDYLTNINIMLLITAVIAAVGIVMYMVTYLLNTESSEQQQAQIQALKSHDSINNTSRVSQQQQDRSKYWHKISKYILKEVLLTFLIFNMFNMSYSAGIQIKYIQQVSSFSIICVLITFVIIIGITAAQIATSKQQFGQYIDKFKREGLQSRYMIATIVYRFTLGFLLAVINDWIASGIVFTFVSAAFLTYICYCEPFNDAFQNTRSKFVHSVHVLILFVNFYYRAESNSNVGQTAQLSLPAYIQISAVVITVIGSTILLAYQFAHKYILKKEQLNISVEPPLKPKQRHQLTMQQFS